MPPENIQKYIGTVCRENRESRNRHKSGVFWMTGLSGSGKSTIAHEVEQCLFEMGFQVYVFDGDNVRHGLCSDLSFSREGRSENIRRIAEAAKLFTDAGVICICAFITPLARDRECIRNIVGLDFHEIFISCPVEICEQRDVKGYYKLARQGKIKNYTGISSPYEAPVSPSLILETEKNNLEDCVTRAFYYVLSNTELDENVVRKVEPYS